jgi:hypothetical protein
MLRGLARIADHGFLSRELPEFAREQAKTAKLERGVIALEGKLPGDDDDE